MAVLMALPLTVNAGQRNTSVEPDYDLSGVEMRITVYTYTSKSELNKAYREKTGDRNPPIDRYGFAQWTVKEVKYKEVIPSDEPRCEIHIIVPTMLEGGPAMPTVGHELLHCLFGNFHS